MRQVDVTMGQALGLAINECAKVREQRDELLAALKAMLAAGLTNLCDIEGCDCPRSPLVVQARAAITKAEK